jgi:hypothetical protein
MVPADERLVIVRSFITSEHGKRIFSNGICGNHGSVESTCTLDGTDAAAESSDAVGVGDGDRLSGSRATETVAESSFVDSAHVWSPGEPDDTYSP